MAVFILAPVFKELEDRIDAIFGVGFQMAVDRDIAPIPNLL